MSIVVLGAGGQLGRSFRKLFAEREESAVFADRSAIDLRDDQNILDGLNAKAPTAVINCAAYTAVDRAEDEPELAHRVNGAAVGTIAKWCADHDAVMIHYSTDYVFDGTKTAPYDEADRPNPQSVYGRSKLAGELAFRDTGCRGICLRTSWVHSNFGANFFLTMRRLFTEREEVKVVDDQFGVPTTTRFIAEQSLAILARYRGRSRNGSPSPCAKRLRQLARICLTHPRKDGSSGRRDEVQSSHAHPLLGLSSKGYAAQKFHLG